MNIRFRVSLLLAKEENKIELHCNKETPDISCLFKPKPFVTPQLVFIAISAERGWIKPREGPSLPMLSDVGRARTGRPYLFCYLGSRAGAILMTLASHQCSPG